MPAFIAPALDQLRPKRSSLSRSANEFRTVDLFAGIGGMRRGFELHGGRCVFASELDVHAKRTYSENFGGGHPLVGDITKIDASDVPDHDVLLGGFPCQPFSIAGVSKKNSLDRAHGFADETQGTLFFDIARIIKEKRPAAFLLENVKNLKAHDRGRTFEVILGVLRDELGYEVHARVVDAAHFTPQHRERIMIVGFRSPTAFTWEEMEVPNPPGRIRMNSILHRLDRTEPFVPSDGVRFYDHDSSEVQSRYTLSPRLWDYLQAYAAKHKALGNGFGFGLTHGQGTSRTLSARYYKDGSEILIEQSGCERPRRLTPRECARLMGFDDDFRIPVSDTQAYKQFGNSVVIPVIEAVAAAMKPHVLQVAGPTSQRT